MEVTGDMATKSFLKEVELKDKNLAHQFVDALESSAENMNRRSNDKDREPSFECTELTGDSIKVFFDTK